MTEYFTFKTQVDLKPGEKLGFTTGKGYYAIAAPVPPPTSNTSTPNTSPPSATPTPSPPGTATAGPPKTATTAVAPTTSKAIPHARQPTTIASLTTALAKLAHANAGPAATPHALQPTATKSSPPKVTRMGVDQPWAGDAPLHGAPGAPGATGSRPPGAAPPPKPNSATPHGGGTSRPPRSDDIALHGRPGGPGATGTGGAVGTQPTAANPNSAGPIPSPVRPVAADDQVRTIQGRKPPGSLIIDPIADAKAPHPPKEWRTPQGRMQYAFRYLSQVLRPDPSQPSQRLKPIQIAAIVGNLSYESTSTKTGKKLVPGLREENGRGIGIAQWTPTIDPEDIDRVDVLKRFASAHELKWTNFGLEIAFVATEANLGGRLYVTPVDGRRPIQLYLLKDQRFLELLSDTRTIEQATKVVMDVYEVPSDTSQASLDGRINDAKFILALEANRLR